MKYGPDRRELRLRIILSCGGLGFLIAALVIHGIPEGPAFFEVIGVAGIFLVGSIIWSAKRLWDLNSKGSETPKDGDKDG